MNRFFLVVAVVAILFVSSAGIASNRPHVFGCGSAGGGWTLLDPVGYDEEMFRMMGQANVTSCRIGASWKDIERERGVYDWSKVDAEVNNCLANGIEPYCLIVNAPSWADGNPDAVYDTPILESAAPYFIKFCTAMAQRYRGKIKYYEFWNEQNGYGWHHENSQFNWYWEYIPWLKRAYEGLKAGNPECQVALGGLDDVEGNAPIFLNGVYSNGGKGYFDAVATHPYDNGRGADNLRNRLRALHNIMTANGDGDKTLWITEWGYNCKLEQQQTQADKISFYLSIILEPEFSYVTMASYLAFADMENDIGDWGFTDQCLRPKAPFYAFQSYPRPGSITIHNATFEDAGTGRVRVKWKTTPAADGQVFYGPTEAYGFSAPVDGTPKTEHSVMIGGLAPGSFYYFKIRSGEAESSGYRVYVPGSTVYNPGFEFGWRGGNPDGWTVAGKSRRLDSSTVGWVNQQHSGGHALMLCLATSWGYTLDDTIYQRVVVGRDRAYEFSSWLWGKSDKSSGAAIVSMVGTDPTGGTDANSPSVIWSSPNNVQNAWQQRSVEAVAKSESVTLFIKVNSSYIDGANHWFAVDDTNLIISPMIGELSGYPDGASVTIKGVVNASSDQFKDHCYIQQFNTPSGIRVNKLGDFCNLGDLATVSGTLTTADGERRIIPASFTVTGSNGIPKPIGLNNSAFLSSSPNHSGALVRIWGTVTETDAENHHFIINDGSTPGGVRVAYDQLTSDNPINPPTVGSRVTVTGVSGTEGDGCVLRVRSQEDVNPL